MYLGQYLVHVHITC